MADELKHLTVGTALTQSEYEAVGGHVFACQAKGDILYASSTSQLSRIGKGAQNTLFSMGACCTPAWVASPSVTDLTIGGGCISLTVATDIDLLDDTVSALSFDASGQVGIIAIDTRNCVEGVTMSGTLGVTGAVTFSADLLIKDQGDLRLEESGSGCSYVAIQAPACLAANYTLTLPADDGCACEFLQTNGSGTLDWAAAGGATLSGSTNNTVVTVTGSCAMIGEANLLFDQNKLYLHECSDGGMTQGIVINQSANDDEIFSFKSSDIAHGFVSGSGAIAVRKSETDTYGKFQKREGNGGGLSIHGYNDGADTGLNLSAFAVGCIRSDKDTDSGGLINIDGGLISGGTQAALNADANLLNIRVAPDATNITTRFIFDTEGSAHADVEFTTFDDQCDIELLRGMLAETIPCYRERFGQDMLYNLEWYEERKLIGKNSIHWEDRPDGRHQLRGMVNFTNLAMLHHSTIIQLHDKLTARLDGLESRLTLPEGK